MKYLIVLMLLFLASCTKTNYTDSWVYCKYCGVRIPVVSENSQLIIYHKLCYKIEDDKHMGSHRAYETSQLEEMR